MKSYLWPEHRIKRLIEKQESQDPNLKNLNIQSPNLHYLNGLLATDGNIRSEFYECRIMLGIKDLDLLKNIQSLYGGKLYINTTKYQRAELSIRYRPFIAYLDSIGIRSKKSLNINVNEYFTSLSTSDKWHFIRGCVDGDGCFCIYNISDTAKRGVFSMVTASEEFAHMVQTFLGNTSSIYTQTLKNIIYTISITGPNIEKILSPMYDNITEDILYIDRKYKKYQEIIEYHKTKHWNPWNKFDESKKKLLVDECKITSLRDVAKRNDVIPQTLRGWCKQNKAKWIV